MLGTFCRIWNFSYQDKKPNQMKQHLAKTEKPTLHKLWVFKPQSRPWRVAEDGRQRGSKRRLRPPWGRWWVTLLTSFTWWEPRTPCQSGPASRPRAEGVLMSWKPPRRRSLPPPEKQALCVCLCLPKTAGWGLGLGASHLGIPSPRQISRLYSGARDGLAASPPSS